jgi:hypothetical protein
VLRLFTADVETNRDTSTDDVARQCATAARATCGRPVVVKLTYAALYGHRFVSGPVIVFHCVPQ